MTAGLWKHAELQQGPTLISSHSSYPLASPPTVGVENAEENGEKSKKEEAERRR